MATTSTKRPRAPSSPSSSLRLSSGSADPPHKASRILPSSSDISDVLSASGSSDTTVRASSNGGGAGSVNSKVPLLCNLPPTCHRQPTPIANTTELERHYAKYHAHVCEERGCGCVFPEARLLELHQTECHNPLAQIRKERGEKIFQCHIPAPTCGRDFLTPKARRLHLIQSHSYPKEYFFAVTNKGIGGLLKKWGEGASMVRKEWKPREEAAEAEMQRYREEESDKMDEDEDDGKDDDEDDDTEEESSFSLQPNQPFVEEEEEEDEDAQDGADLEATPRMLPRTTGIASPQPLISTPRQKHAHIHPASAHAHTHAGKGAESVDVSGLVSSLDSLSLVPDSIRFGRGGKINGFAGAPRGSAGGAARGARGRGVGRGRARGDFIVTAARRGGAVPSVPGGAQFTSAPSYDDLRGAARGRGRGRGARGRARGVFRGRGA